MYGIGGLLLPAFHSYSWGLSPSGATVAWLIFLVASLRLVPKRKVFKKAYWGTIGEFTTIPLGWVINLEGPWTRDRDLWAEVQWTQQSTQNGDAMHRLCNGVGRSLVVLPWRLYKWLLIDSDLSHLGRKRLSRKLIDKWITWLGNLKVWVKFFSLQMRTDKNHSSVLSCSLMWWSFLITGEVFQYKDSTVSSSIFGEEIPVMKWNSFHEKTSLNMKCFS